MVYPFERRGSWVGNWCWDVAIVTAETAAKLLNDARRSDWWYLDMGVHPWWDRWDSGEPFTAAHFLGELQGRRGWEAV